MEPKGLLLQNKHPPPTPILSHSNPVYASPSNLLKTNFSIILPSTSRSSKWSLSITSLHQNAVCTSPVPHMCHISHPSLSSWCDHQNNNISPGTFSFLGSKSFSAPSSWMYSAYVSSWMWESQVTHSYKITGKIIVLYILILILLGSRLANKRCCTEWQQTFPDFNLLLIFPWMEFWFVIVVST